MNDNTEIDTEIQLSELKVWADRSLFYLSKMYTEQIKSGEPYNVFKKCVSISILDFILFPDENRILLLFPYPGGQAPIPVHGQDGIPLDRAAQAPAGIKR